MNATTFTHAEFLASTVTAALAADGFEVGDPVVVRRQLLDSFDGLLYADGLRLDALDVAGSKGVGLVLTADDSPPAHLDVPMIPRLAGDLPKGPFRDRISRALSVRALSTSVMFAARRTTALRRDPAGKVTVTVAVYDALEVTGPSSPDTAMPVWAVEVHEHLGAPRAGAEVRSRLAALGLVATNGDALDLAATQAGVDRRGFNASPTVPMDRHQPALVAFRRVLANLAATVDATWPGTVDDVDPEFLHDLRVAVRRTRSVLAQAKGILDPSVRATYREGFGWLGGATGPARDLDVYVIEWDSYVAPLGRDAAALAPVLGHLIERRRAEHEALSAVLASDRYRDLMAGWRVWLHDDTADAGDGRRQGDAPVGEVVAQRISRAQATLLERGRTIDADTAAEVLHELRKDAKKLRYLLECFGGLLKPIPRKAFVQRLKALQDNLGEHQDAEVHVAQLRGFSHELADSPAVGPDTLLAMGQLTGRLEERRLAARRDFAERFSAYDTKQTARTLDELLDGPAGR